METKHLRAYQDIPSNKKGQNPKLGPSLKAAKGTNSLFATSTHAHNR
jgi:hypothetical protein